MVCLHVEQEHLLGTLPETALYPVSAIPDRGGAKKTLQINIFRSSWNLKQDFE